MQLALTFLAITSATIYLTVKIVRWFNKKHDDCEGCALSKNSTKITP